MLLVGDPTRLQSEFDAWRGVLADRSERAAELLRTHVEIVPAGSVIGMDEHPAQAVRSKRDASVVVATRLVADGRAQAAVSAGNSGATLAAALLTVGRIRGVARPAIGATFPSATSLHVPARRGRQRRLQAALAAPVRGHGRRLRPPDHGRRRAASRTAQHRRGGREGLGAGPGGPPAARDQRPALRRQRRGSRRLRRLVRRGGDRRLHRQRRAQDRRGGGRAPLQLHLRARPAPRSPASSAAPSSSPASAPCATGSTTARRGAPSCSASPARWSSPTAAATPRRWATRCGPRPSPPARR